MYNDKTIIQIGSHVGPSKNDPVFDLVKETTRLVLVEPVPYLFTKLQENYTEMFPNKYDVIYINKAVSDYVGEIELTIPSEKNDFSSMPFYASQLASVNETHASNHIPGLITETIVVPTTTIDEIVDCYDISNIDLLHTDTEGHDYNILMGYSFKVKPNQILFEHKHMDGFFTCGENFKRLTEYLETKGYAQKYQTDEDTMMELVISDEDNVMELVVTDNDNITEVEITDDGNEKNKLAELDERLKRIESILERITDRFQIPI